MSVRRINSRSNDHFKSLIQLLTTRGQRKQGRFLISGRKVVLETLRDFPTLCEELLLPLPAESTPRLESTLGAELAPAFEKARSQKPEFLLTGLDPELLAELDVSGTHDPLLVCRTPQLAKWVESTEPSGLEILCALGDPSNLGALIRSAAAFGASRIVLLKESASPWHPKSVRAASGSLLRVPLETGPSIQDLKSPMIALDMKGVALPDYVWSRNARLLLGEEGQGTPESANFTRVAIPMAKGVESLNATVASSLALYAYRLQHP